MMSIQEHNQGAGGAHSVRTGRREGFTFIEIIASLVIFGFLFTIAGMGVIMAARGYMLTKENAHMAQKAQLGMIRLKRELVEIVDIIAKDDTRPYLIYDHLSERKAVAKDGSVIRLFSNLGTATTLPAMSQGDILIDDIDRLTLQTWKESDPWILGSDAITELTTVAIAFVMRRLESDVDSKTFTTVVRPRNIRR